MFDSTAKLGPFRIGADGAVTFHNVTVKLSAQETRFLRVLVLNAGRAVSFDALLTAIRHDDDSAPEGEILKVLAYKVRKKLQRISPKHGIQTLVGTGYGIGVLGVETPKAPVANMTFHNAMMTFLDTSTHSGESKLGAEHYVARQALRLAHMRGAPIQNERELIEAIRAFRESIGQRSAI